MQFSGSMISINVRDDLIRYQLAILQPSITVLAETLLLVSEFAVDKEYSEVDNVKVCDDHTPTSSFSLNDLGAEDSSADVAAVYW
jgi:hypothetical protein